MIDVKLIRMITGEEIIAEVVDFANGILTIKNALAVIPQQGQIGFAPWATVISLDHPDIALDIKHVIYSVEVQPCLLYTSPSPRDRTRSRMPSSA